MVVVVIRSGVDLLFSLYVVYDVFEFCLNKCGGREYTESVLPKVEKVEHGAEFYSSETTKQYVAWRDTFIHGIKQHPV